MRFRVVRTSTKHRNDVPSPCKGAEPGQVDRWDIRTFKSPEEHDAQHEQRWGKWATRGTDHQVIRGPRGGALGIKRKVGEEQAWFVEIGSLEDLIAFQAEYGDLVHETDPHYGDVPTIEIYDGYRE